MRKPNTIRILYTAYTKITLLLFWIF